MAFTDKEKADIRRALGWPARFHQISTSLEQAMVALDDHPDHEEQIRGLLVCVEDCKAALKSSWKRLKASSVGSIHLKTLHEEIAGLRFEGRRLVGDMAAILGVAVGHDTFGSSRNRNTINGGHFNLL